MFRDSALDIIDEFEKMYSNYGLVIFGECDAVVFKGIFPDELGRPTVKTRIWRFEDLGFISLHDITRRIIREKIVEFITDCIDHNQISLPDDEEVEDLFK